MKKIAFICFLGLMLVFLPFENQGQAAEDKISDNISKLLEVIEHLPHEGPEQAREFILVCLDSILLTAALVDIPQNIQSEIKENIDAYRSTDYVILQQDAINSLWKAARRLDPDFDVNIPDDATPESIKDDIRLELHQAKSFHDQEKDNRVIEIFLRTVLRVVTPVKR